MDFITEHIAIGNRQDAENLELLQREGLTAVLNVAWDLDIRYSRSSASAHVYPIEYQKVGLIDGEGNQPGTLLAAALMLRQLAARHRKVLVHCHAGVSRSSTVVSLYLASCEGISFHEALNRVRLARPVVNPHAALIHLAIEVGKWQTALRL